MALLSQSQRTALGYWWDLIVGAVQQGFSATDTTQLANQVAHDLGGSLSFSENRDIATLYGYARRIENSGEALQSGSPEQGITASMIAVAPFARDDQARAAYPLYNVKFTYEYLDQAGNRITTTKTDAIPLQLPGTLGELTQQVLDDAEAMANKYGHTLLSATPIQILAV